MEPKLDVDFRVINDVGELYNFILNKIKIEVPNHLNNIVACDVHYGEYAFVSCVLYDIKDRVMIEEVSVKSSILYSYKPGLFALREVPPIMDSLRRLYNKPDCIILDGHGIAHPKKAGLACFVGVIYDIPAIGVAKSPLVGNFHIPCEDRGCWEPVYYKSEKVGEVVRTRSKTKPIFVSPGHRINFSASRNIVLNLVMKSKLPEPLRLAHLRAKSMAKLLKKGG
ncbi:MAG TPA: endonuclease V [candidate division WOR-3 bacterium]|uniref:Endonuclease V n=1 Tax=candidate division WOR-3 bacterium TaxID=2052148 RepID=A0A7C5HMT8_UNCW3|nr:endonuclease V [candidate division WOR-3 bacterium]